MLKTSVDITTIMKSVAVEVAESFDSASIIAEYETPEEVLNFSQEVFERTLDQFSNSFRTNFQAAYVTELVKQLNEQSVKFH
ncbi:toxin-antitoxin system, toxin component [Enterococcus rivorum]|uniref:Toxin-antitoxin system, toxin component n=1 Tax=Enterococcus rivorum TaxID=762845 RepID=A0A1E5KXX7_9ENTE|nr:toxin-antitoxin system, toxin component [Enterococcus rivorum]MBP2099679.1 FPC/CPF motif-containing protein YcgG [Enterococcus rivorum]OEH82705.1 toxin-antitoxin system, toxin component [Enterococcus rivorum]